MASADVEMRIQYSEHLNSEQESPLETKVVEKKKFMTYPKMAVGIVVILAVVLTYAVLVPPARAESSKVDLRNEKFLSVAGSTSGAGNSETQSNSGSQGSKGSSKGGSINPIHQAKPISKEVFGPQRDGDDDDEDDKPKKNTDKTATTDDTTDEDSEESETQYVQGHFESERSQSTTLPPNVGMTQGK